MSHRFIDVRKKDTSNMFRSANRTIHATSEFFASKIIDLSILKPMR